MVLLIAKNFQLVKISQADFGIKNPRQPKLTRATETKSNQADLEKFTVWVMCSTRIKEKFCRVDPLHMRYRGHEFESVY